MIFLQIHYWKIKLRNRNKEEIISNLIIVLRNNRDKKHHQKPKINFDYKIYKLNLHKGISKKEMIIFPAKKHQKTT